MRFSRTSLQGVWVLEPERFDDHRGSFLRNWCQREMSAMGLRSDFVQSSVSLNPHRGTLRGMHWQAAPHGETKVVRCVRGAVLDVVVDIRENSPTQWQWTGIELTGDNFRSLYIPEGFAHGFQTLTYDVELNYHITSYYETGSGRGLRYDDPAIAIGWPLPVSMISDQDSNWPLLQTPNVGNAA